MDLLHKISWRSFYLILQVVLDAIDQICHRLDVDDSLAKEEFTIFYVIEAGKILGIALSLKSALSRNATSENRKSKFQSFVICIEEVSY